MSGWSRGGALRWGVAALLGVAMAVALTLATLRLTDQHVGLSGEPAGAGRGLVPAATATGTTTRSTITRTVTVTVPTPTPTTAQPPAPARTTPSGDDHGDDHGQGEPDDD